MPSQLPSGLQILDLWTEDGIQQESLPCSLQGVPGLRELGLSFSYAKHILSRGQWPELSALKKLTLTWMYFSDSDTCDLSPLQAAAARGADVALEISLSDCRSLDQPVLWFTAHDRQRLWVALAQVPSLWELELCDLDVFDRHASVSVQEQQLLTSVHCKQLVLADRNWTPYSQPLLHFLDCDFVLCAYTELVTPDPDDLPWARLSVRPGVYVLAVINDLWLRIDGCTGQLPVLDAPWALVLRQPQEGVFEGLPLELFSPGPHGYLVWRNSAVSDDMLREAYDRLEV